MEGTVNTSARGEIMRQLAAETIADIPATYDSGQAGASYSTPEPSRPLLRVPVTSEFRVDNNGNPKGGTATGEGFWITWQDGVEERRGAFLEEVVEAALQRLRFFQSSKFACAENADAILHFEAGLRRLADRTANRLARGVEGTYTP